MSKAEQLVNSWNAASVPNRHRILARLGLHYKVTRLDGCLFEEMPQKFQRTAVHTAEVLKD